MVTEFNEYQDRTSGTAIYRLTCPDETSRIIYLALGLSGESAEVANKVKKIIRDDNGKITDDRKKQISEEIGDIMWYAARLAAELGYDLSDVASGNLSKLESRSERGVLGGSGDSR